MGCPLTERARMRNMLKATRWLVVSVCCVCHGATGQAQSRDAEPATRATNEGFVKSLPFADRADFDDAKRGFIATLPDGVVAGVGGRVAFNTKPYAFLQKDEAPATVNPS